MKVHRLRRKGISTVINPKRATWLKLLLGKKLYEHRKMIGVSVMSFLISLMMFLDILSDGHLEAKGAKIGGLAAYGIVAFFSLIFVFLLVATINEWRDQRNV